MSRRKDVTVGSGTGHARGASQARGVADQVGLTVRMREELRSKLARSAERRRVSLNQEVLDRLEDSFLEQEQAGGAEVQELARLWLAAFRRGGALGARAVGHPEWAEGGEWTKDLFAYRAAVHAGTDALLAAAPHPGYRVDATPEEISTWERLNDVFARAVARGAEVKVEQQP